MSIVAQLAHAVWIGSDHPFDLHEVYLDFRSPAIWADAGDEVELLITADSRYRLWVNGRFAARGPARCYPHAQSVDRIALNSYWCTGENILAVQLYQPGYSHFSYVHRGAAGILACLKVNGETVLVTDRSWSVRRNHSFATQVARVSIYGSGQEVRDLNLEDNWQTSAYMLDDWANARIVASCGGEPWPQLVEREVPQLVERDASLSLLETRLIYGTVAMVDDSHQVLRDGWPSGQPITFDEDSTGWIRPHLPDGTGAVWVYDLGRAHTCQGWVEVCHATGKEKLSVSYAEKTVDGELVISDPNTYCRMQITDTFSLRAGNQIIESFALRGGRYILFHLSGEIGQSFAFRPHIRVAEYPLQFTSLVTEDPLLAKIVTMCEATLHACLQDTFVDCVWREGAQWLGDALPQSLSLWAMSDDYRPIRKILLDSARGQYEDGILPSVVPAEVHAYTIPRYSCMWIELLAFYYQITSDREFLEHLWPTVETVIEGLLLCRDNTGLVITPPGRRHYIDWSPTSQSNPHCVTNLHVVLSLQTALDLANLSGLPAGSSWGDDSRLLANRSYLTFWRDGRWYDDQQHTTYSQLAAAMALLAEAGDPQYIDDLLASIAARSLDPSDEYADGDMVLASPFMHHYLFLALGQYGRWQAVIDIVKLRWGRWVQWGYPTTWENWNVDFPDGSQCHAFSAHPRYHLQQALQAILY